MDKKGVPNELKALDKFIQKRKKNRGEKKTLCVTSSKNSASVVQKDEGRGSAGSGADC